MRDRRSPWLGSRIDYESHIGEHLAEVERDVLGDGFAVCPAFGAHFSSGYVHTVGLVGRGLPEVVLCGFVPELGEVIVGRIAVALLSAGWGRLSDVGMCDGRFVNVLVDDARGQSVEFGFAAMGPDHVVLELADRFYMRRVPFVYAVTEGWPCVPCSGVKDTVVACTCVFSCWHMRCRVPSDP